MQITKIYCDICKKIIDNDNLNCSYHMSFSKPSKIIDTLELDLCEDCYHRIKSRINYVIKDEKRSAEVNNTILNYGKENKNG